MAQYFDIKSEIKPLTPTPVQHERTQAVTIPKSFVPSKATKPKFFKSWKILGSLILVIGISLLALGIYIKPLSIGTMPVFSESEPVLPVASAAETKESPWSLSIPSIKLDTAIQEVGLTGEGDMGVPSNYIDVGWLNTGPRPGDTGNAVMAGHLNAGINKPAVFENLHNLKPGDYIYVKDKTKNMEQRFRVLGSQSYNVSDAPLEKIFGDTDGSNLNLITCSGNWDKTKKDYDQRLVVFSELSQP